MRISGLGSTWPTSVPDSSVCGVNPCRWYENVGSIVGATSDACVAFLDCAIPNDPTTIGQHHLIGGAAAAVGEDVGGTVADVASGLGTGLGYGLGGNINLSGIAIVAAAVGLFLLFRK